MDWMEWIFLAVALITCGALVVLRMKGFITTDAATVVFGTFVSLIRKAEKKWRGYQAAGPQKKAWVLAQLQAIGHKMNPTAAGALIDAIVAWLNASGWEK